MKEENDNHSRENPVPLVTFSEAAVRRGEALLFENTDWRISGGEFWAMTGPNGSGKSTLMKAMTGGVPVVKGRLFFGSGDGERTDVELVSEEKIRRLIAWTEGAAGSRYFTSGDERMMTVRTYLFNGGELSDTESPAIAGYLAATGVTFLMDREFRFLSSGELKRVALMKSLLRNPRVLVVEEPFDGIDKRTRAVFSSLFEELTGNGMAVVIATHRVEEIPPAVSHVLAVRDCRVVWQGRRCDVPAFVKVLSESKRGKAPKRTDGALTPSGKGNGGDPIIEMRGVTVRYGDTTILDGLNWKVEKGERWAITGPNGAGKSMLLSLIFGDNPQAYANDMYLFGKKKGSGETIFELKKRIGFVSTEMQIRHPRGTVLEDIVVSGLYDSFGLYRRVTEEDRERARRWIERVGLKGRESDYYRSLSWGEQRLTLIARAMVKNPELLILDEPCQGLDARKRETLVEIVDAIAEETDCTILYVAHFQDEIPACVSKILEIPHLREGKDGR